MQTMGKRNVCVLVHYDMGNGHPLREILQVIIIIKLECLEEKLSYYPPVH
jgi:hypothetical protein